MRTFRSHADARPTLRQKKAAKIERIVQPVLGRNPPPDILEIGVGSGLIASHFVSAAKTVWGVDVVDERVVCDFAFAMARAEMLPFPNAAFDLVISNHVIEHVDNSQAHLREIKRVLKPNGVAYLATPNRFALLEPHYRLPLLSWLPTRLSDRYVRLLGRGDGYDVSPMTPGDLRRMAVGAGLDVKDVTREAARLTAQIEGGVIARLAATIFAALWPLATHMSPTVVYILGRRDALPESLPCEPAVTKQTR